MQRRCREKIYWDFLKQRDNLQGLSNAEKMQRENLQGLSKAER